MIREDFIFDENGDFPLADKYVNGVYQDTAYGVSDQQHIVDIIVYQKGWLKQFPSLGFGIDNYANAEISTQSIDRTLTIEMEKDGYSVRFGAVVPLQDEFAINTKLIIPK